MTIQDDAFWQRVLARLERKRAAMAKVEAMLSQPQAKAKPVAKPQARAMTTSEFRQQVDAMVSDGMDRKEAIRELSRAMGLSRGTTSGGYFQQVKQSYRR